MSEMYENNAVENEIQEENYEEVSVMKKKSRSFKGKLVAFGLGVVTAVGVGLYNKYKKKRPDEFDEEIDYEDVDDEDLTEIEAEFDKEDSSEENE